MNKRSTRGSPPSAPQRPSRSARSPAVSRQAPTAATANVTITWWHNATGEPLPGFWEEVARRVRGGHPNVTVEVDRLSERGTPAHAHPERAAFRRPARPLPEWGAAASSPPRSRPATSWTSATGRGRHWTPIGGTVDAVAGDGKTYGLPFTFGIEGFWYNKDLFAQAGIDGAPDDPRRAQRRGRQAQGRRHRPDRGRRRRQVARRALVVQLRAASRARPRRLQKAQTELDFRRPVLRRGRRAAQGLHRHQAVPGGLPRHHRPAGRRQLRGPGRQRQGRDGAHGPLEPRRHGRSRRGDRAKRLPPSSSAGSRSRRSPAPQGDPTAALGGGDGFACSARTPAGVRRAAQVHLERRRADSASPRAAPACPYQGLPRQASPTRTCSAGRSRPRRGVATCSSGSTPPSAPRSATR